MADPPDSAADGPVTVYVCQSCQTEGADVEGSSDGAALLTRLEALASDPERVIFRGVECLAVCERPVSIAFSSLGKWSYLIGDVGDETPAEDVLAAAEAVHATPHGVPEMADRPAFFRDGVVSRVPPPNWVMLS